MHPNTAFIPTDINTQSNKRNSLPRAMPITISQFGMRLTKTAYINRNKCFVWFNYQ